MRLVLGSTLVILAVACGAYLLRNHPTSRAFSAASPTGSAVSKPDFDSEIKPIFQARCQPCHFQGGKVYEKLPFDKAETITRLGTRLFTRIKDEKEQQKIRAFLANP
jgi:hypothetical protein